MSHRQAVVAMLVVTLLWSTAGVVTRQLDATRGFELTFWRSACNALTLAVLLGAWRGPAALGRSLRHGGRALWLSGLCWCVMFTAFMLALTLTTVANVLITMSLAPLFTAGLARIALSQRLPPRTWAAIGLAGVGIVWMYGAEVRGDARHVWGTAVALAVPVAAAVNWTLLQHLKGRPGNDMLPAVLIGALLSAGLALPLAWPLTASPHDIALLALLGALQLAVPCVLAVLVARVLAAPEVSLLALLEVVFGVAWAWLGTAETPSVSVIGGGGLVLLALVFNEAAGLRAMSAARVRP